MCRFGMTRTCVGRLRIDVVEGQDGVVLVGRPWPGSCPATISQKRQDTAAESTPSSAARRRRHLPVQLGQEARGCCGRSGRSRACRGATASARCTSVLPAPAPDADGDVVLEAAGRASVPRAWSSLPPGPRPDPTSVQPGQRRSTAALRRLARRAPRRPRNRWTWRSGYSGVRPVSTSLRRGQRDEPERPPPRRDDREDEHASRFTRQRASAGPAASAGARRPREHLARQRRDRQRRDLVGRGPAAAARGPRAARGASRAAVGLHADAAERDGVAAARRPAARASPRGRGAPCSSRGQVRRGRCDSSDVCGTSHMRPISRPSARRTSSTRPVPLDQRGGHA